MLHEACKMQQIVKLYIANIWLNPESQEYSVEAPVEGKTGPGQRRRYQDIGINQQDGRSHLLDVKTCDFNVGQVCETESINQSGGSVTVSEYEILVLPFMLAMGLFGSVVEVVFQSAFYLEIHQNHVFLFFKIYF